MWSRTLRGPLRPRTRALVFLLALALGVYAIVALAGSPTESSATDATVAATGGGSLVERGHALFEQDCSSCHGLDAEGEPGQAPSLVGAGAAAADFYLSTGRMPLDQVGDEPLRAEPRYGKRELEALVAYVASTGKGPAIPKVHPEDGSVRRGMELFSESCQGCHGIGGAGGVVIGGYAPGLDQATPTQVGEAIRVGPYLMPRFSPRQLSDRDVDSIARYVQLTQNPDDAGGYGLGHIGPVPEGAVAWLAAIIAILLVARLIGERTGDSTPQTGGGLR